MNNAVTLNPPLSIVRPLRLRLSSAECLLRRKFNLRIFWILPLVLTGILLVFCIFQINSVIQKAYLLQGYEKKLNEISRENKKLEINFAKVNSLENIESLVKNLNYEKVGKIRYIQVLEGQIVTK